MNPNPAVKMSKRAKDLVAACGVAASKIEKPVDRKKQGNFSDQKAIQAQRNISHKNHVPVQLKQWSCQEKVVNWLEDVTRKGETNYAAAHAVGNPMPAGARDKSVAPIIASGKSITISRNKGGLEDDKREGVKKHLFPVSPCLFQKPCNSLIKDRNSEQVLDSVQKRHLDQLTPLTSQHLITPAVGQKGNGVNNHFATVPESRKVCKPTSKKVSKRLDFETGIAVQHQTLEPKKSVDIDGPTLKFGQNALLITKPVIQYEETIDSVTSPNVEVEHQTLEPKKSVDIDGPTLKFGQNALLLKKPVIQDEETIDSVTSPNVEIERQTLEPKQSDEISPPLNFGEDALFLTTPMIQDEETTDSDTSPNIETLGPELIEIDVPVLHAVEVSSNHFTIAPGSLVDFTPQDSNSNNVLDLRSSEEEGNLSDADEPTHPKRKKAGDEQPSKLTRKRQRNPAQWVKTVTSKMCRMGQEYVNVKGKTVPAKKMGPGCKKNCRLKCHSKVSVQERELIFKKYYERSTTLEKSWDYVCRHVTKVPKKASTTHEESKKQFTYKYSFRIGGRHLLVCKTMFLSTLCLSNSVVVTAFNKLGDGGTISPSKVGKVKINNKRAISENLKQSVRDHINTFPKVESHYIRKDSKREYLPEGLSVAAMHRDYVLWMKGKNLREDGSNTEEYAEDNFSDEELSDISDTDRPTNAVPDPSDVVVIKDPNVASERQYRDIFNTEFNLSFHKPKKDQCDDCVIYNNANPEEKSALQPQYDLHHKQKDMARELKKNDKEATKEDPQLAFCCFDLQKVHYFPQGEASGFFYCSRLSAYNFTVYEVKNLNNVKGFCFTWDESVAARGSNEIGSCLLKYFQDAIKRGVKEFRMYSDNCIGQNKNRFVFSLYVYVSALFKVKIIHRFLVKGHTQNEGDAMHSRIEDAAKGKKMLVPGHWRKVMKTAKVTGEPYTVLKMTTTDFLNFKNLADKQNWDILDDGGRVQWLKIREVEVNDGLHLSIKYDYDQEIPRVLTVKKNTARPLNLLTFRFTRAYNGKRPLSDATKRGLLEIVRKGIIQSKYCRYYKSLCR